MNFNDALLKIGFTPIEATVYMMLCKHGALTGYEVSKLSSISRSNVYGALYSLQEKGRCYLVEGEATKYSPLSKDELLLTVQRELAEILTVLEKQFPESVETTEPYITIKGYDNVLQKIRNMLLTCSSHIYILCTPLYIALFKEELITLSQNKKVVIICDKHISLGNALVYKRSKSPQGFHMIIDTQSVITGEIADNLSQCLFTNNESLVRLIRESFIAELDLIKLTNI